MTDRPNYLESIRPLFIPFRIRHVVQWIMYLIGVAAIPFALVGINVVIDVAIVALAFGIFMYGNRLDRKFRRKVWAVFARTYGDPGAAVSREIPMSATMQKLGVARESAVSASGQISGVDFSVADMRVDFFQNAKDVHSQYYRIFAIRTGSESPDIYIHRKRIVNVYPGDGMPFVRESLRYNAKLKAAGGTNQYFDIFIEPDAQIADPVSLDTQQLLAIKGLGKKFDVEFAGKYIYIIADYRIFGIQDMTCYQQEVLDALVGIKAQLERKGTAQTSGLKISQPPPLNMSVFNIFGR